jgi:protein-disulfide isomerase
MPLRAASRPSLVVLALSAIVSLTACGGASGEERAAAAATPSAQSAAGTPAATVATTDGAAAGAAVPDAAIRGEGGAMPADSTAQRAAADSGRISGSPDAKVWLLMVSDFQCPYCKMWHDQSYEALRKEYVDGGKVRMAYMNFPLDQHEQAVPSAEAAMCASAQKKFWPYQSALFGAIERWGKPGDQTAVYESLATAQGLDMTRFRSCMRSHVMRAVVEGDRVRMQQAGVQSTPSFFVGNQAIAGAQPTDAFRRALDAALGGTPVAR